ncbi:type IVB secretion system protein IcmH/DotU [Flexibacterium corallicola]|uniref:type IVB secretion system protein IcmH/DotU n=1 Tax=Flexibacterium corallicola TaxID=3037259 RepID=UPI00286F01C5|nr:type IVB secretion system protein IcmH/DotU [Pseudovibrio sp. M1P-2-3]
MQVSTPTLTVTPEGVVPPDQRDKAGTALVRLSSSDIQKFVRLLAHYSGSKNALINISADLLGVCGTIRRLSPEEELSTTRLELTRTIIDLKYKVVQLDYPPSVAENLCLLFAIVLDEFILLREWGQDSGWENRTLVADLFGFRDGGNRFYEITERALMQPKVLRDFLEIIYVFLKLGYRGKYSHGDEYESERLIERLETSLNLVPLQIPKKMPGRALQETTAPSPGISVRLKLLSAGAAIVVMCLISWSSQLLEAQSVHERFADARAAAASEGAKEYIYSSQSGTMKVERQ